MAGLEPNIIYVNLDLTADAPGLSEPNGAPLCGVASMNHGGPPTGTEGYPISFNQFRKHVQYRLTQNESGKTRTYRIKGICDTTVDYGAEGVNTGIFNINYVATSPTDAYTVIFENWDDEPYKMKISTKTTAAVLQTPIAPYLMNPSLFFVNTTNVIVYIKGMDVEAGIMTDKNGHRDIGDIRFTNNVITSDYNSHNYKNSLTLKNCRFFTNGMGVFTVASGKTGNTFTEYKSYKNAYSFDRYATVKIQNCLFDAYIPGCEICYIDYPVASTGGISWDLYYDIANTIYLNIVNILRGYNGYSGSIAFSSDISNNVFSGPISGYTGSTTYPSKYVRLLNDVSDLKSQFNFPIPNGVDGGISLPNTYFNYLENGWENIDVIGVRSKYSNVETYGIRDGVGPLNFQELPIPIITASNFVTTVGSTITLGVEDYANYNLTYQPSLYGWYKNNNATPFAVGGEEASHDVPLAITTKGMIPIKVKVHSHNDWYTLENSVNIRSLINTNTIALSLETFNINDVDTDTFHVNDPVKIVVKAIPDTDVKSYWMNFDGTWIQARIYTVQFKSIGPVDILGKIMLKDGTVKYTSKTITIAEGVYKTYYVDLSIEYEQKQKFKLNYVIYDNFEDKSIDPAFSSPFNSNYIVKYMYDEYVASHFLANTNAQMTTGILDGKFNVAWSFVRDTASTIPKMRVIIDGLNYTAEWDYIENRLNIYSGSNLLRRISYGNYSPDMTCPNALHKMFCQFIMVNGKLSFVYSVDDKTYVTNNIATIGTFALASVNADADSHSGYGFVSIEADNVNSEFGNGLALVKGSEEYPLTYPEMVVRISPNGTGEFADTYKCRHWRETEYYLASDRDKQFNIDVWNPDKYGPWMLRFYLTDVNLTGTTLSNGIIYNVPSYPSPSLLHITITYNMFITWNGSNSKIILEKYFNRYTGKDKRVDIIGSTIKSEGGFLTGG